MKKVKFIFHEDGTVETDASGFKGNECVKMTDALLKGLDPELKHRKVKGEFHVHEKTRATVHK